MGEEPDVTEALRGDEGGGPSNVRDKRRPADMDAGADVGGQDMCVNSISNLNGLHNQNAASLPEGGAARAWTPATRVEQNAQNNIGDASPQVDGEQLCGGCNLLKGRADFEHDQWIKADAWSRDEARRCIQCQHRTTGDSCLGERSNAAAARRSGRARKRVNSAADTVDECQLRSMEQILCPGGCQCENSLPMEQGLQAEGAQSRKALKARAVRGEGLQETATGVIAIEQIEAGEIITCFGSSATVLDNCNGPELVRVMNTLTERGGTSCQYTFRGSLGGAGTAPVRAWVIPPPDIQCLVREPLSAQLKSALAKRGPIGIGHLVNHSCCTNHRNAELAVRWKSEDRKMAVVIVVATKRILPGDRVLVHYSPEGDDFQKWTRNFKCTCCQCRGACAQRGMTGPSDLLQAMRGGLPLDLEAGVLWRHGVSPEVGTRVRVNTEQGRMVGNVTLREGSRVQIRGTYAGSKRVVSIDGNVTKCTVVGDRLVWEDLSIEATALQRVVYQESAENQSDFLEDSVLTALCRWALYGDSAHEGLPQRVHRDWVLGTYTFKKMQEAWEQVRSQPEPMAALLQGLSQPTPKELSLSRKGTCKNPLWLQLDPDLHDNIYIPINLARTHWLLAWMDIRNREMHLLDCSRGVGKGWWSDIHGLMWVWFVASVRRIRVMQGADIEDPVWSIDASVVDLQTLRRLPGFTAEACRQIAQLRTSGKGSLAGTQTILGNANLQKLTNLNVVIRWGGQSRAGHWQWSSHTTANVPQQPRHSDCAIFTFLFIVFKNRGWDLAALASLNPQQAREWILRILFREGKWVRSWTCCVCGAEIERPVDPTVASVGHPHPKCGGTELEACRRRLEKQAQTEERGHTEPTTETEHPPGRQVNKDQQGGAAAVTPAGVSPAGLTRERLEAMSKQTNRLKRERREATSKQTNRLKRERLEAMSKQTNRSPNGQGSKLGRRLPPARECQGDGKLGEIHEGRPSQPSIAAAHSRKAEIKETDQLMGEATSAQLEEVGSLRAAHPGPVHKEVFQIRERSSGIREAGVKCAECGLWGAPLQADATSGSFVCNRKCLQSWWPKFMTRKDGKQAKEPARLPADDTDRSRPPPPTPNTSCEQCGEGGACRPCERCWQVWYCTEACEGVHRDKHKSVCRTGAWCVNCGSQDQKSWCPSCNLVAYCSAQCKDQDWHIHREQCNGRWDGVPRSTPARQDGFSTPLEDVLKEAQIRRFRNSQSHHASDETTSDGDDVVEDKQGMHRDAIVQLLANSQCLDNRQEASCEEAAANLKHKLEMEEQELRMMLQQLVGPRTAASAVIDLQHDRRWARWRLRPFLQTARATRIRRLLGKYERHEMIRIRILGIPAENEMQAASLLAAAGVHLERDETCKAAFSTRTKRSTARGTTMLKAVARVDDALRDVWCGQTRVGGVEVICECEEHGQDDEDEEACKAVLLPAHAYASDLLRQWTRIWKWLGLTELEVRDLVIWSTELTLPDWQIDELHIWSPGAPRNLRDAWEGWGSAQGQIRLKGSRIACEHRNAHHLGNLHAIGGRESFVTRDVQQDQHLPRGAKRDPRRERVQLGLPAPEQPTQRSIWASQEGDTVMQEAPNWVRLGKLEAAWEPATPGSEWEAASAVCIKFQQVRMCESRGQVQASRVEIRKELVNLLNNIQTACGICNKEFTDADVGYAAFTNRQGSREGMITIQKRDPELLDDDILVGAVLGFHVGNEVQNLTTRKYKWCPISGRLGETVCGIRNMTAAHSWGGCTRRQLRMGTQRAGERTWRIRDSKEGTVRRILALVRGRGNAKEALLARLRTTPWSRRQTTLVQASRSNPASSEKQPREEVPALPAVVAASVTDDARKADTVARWSWMLERWADDWEHSLCGETQGQGTQTGTTCRGMKRTWFCMNGDKAAARAVTGDWKLLNGLAREQARCMAHLQLMDAIQGGTFSKYMHELQERGHVGLAHEGLQIEADVSRHSPALDSRGVRDRVRAWRRWLDWEVQMERPHIQANVSVWNLGPLGYAASKEQLREALNCNRAVVMVQEVCFPMGAQRRVKQELNDLHPDYHCILEVGREALTDDVWDAATNKGASPWCSRKHFAVASFFHSSVFKSVQRLEWDTEGKTRRLRHMTRGRVLWVDAVTHGGKKVRTINIHQATSSDLDLQRRVLDILRKSIVDSRNQMILLGGDLNANAGGDRQGYAESNKQHLRQVDKLLTDFVQETGGRLVSPATLSWKSGEGGRKGARLDHVVCWNMPLHGSAGQMGLEWKAVGAKAPEGSRLLQHDALQHCLTRATSIPLEDWETLGIQDVSAQSVVQVGNEFYQPVVYGRADWVGNQAHDHARISVSVATDVLLFERNKVKGPKTRPRRIDLDDWKRITPELNAALCEQVKARRTAILGEHTDVGAAVSATLQERNQLAQSLLAPTTRSRQHQQRRREHRDREQIRLQRDIARAEAALRDGPQDKRVTTAQRLCLRDVELAQDGVLGPQDILTILRSEHWTKLLEERIRVSKVALQALTQAQIRASRQEMDRRARREFERAHKGPSRFAGKRANSHQPELLRWAVPVGFQWVGRGGLGVQMEWEQKAQELRSRCPEAVVQFESGEACVAEVQVREGEMELAMRRISVARESWNRRVAGQEREAFAEEVRDVVQQRQLRADSHIDLEMLAEDVTNKVARKVVRDRDSMAVGREGLRGQDTFRWCSRGPRAREFMDLWINHLMVSEPAPAPFRLTWRREGLVITHVESGRSTTVNAEGRWQKAHGGEAPADGPRAPESAPSPQAPAENTHIGAVRILNDQLRNRRADTCEDLVIMTVTVPQLTLVSEVLRISQGWETRSLIDRQLLFEDGPWKGENMTIAWELYFQSQGLAPHAWCGTDGCTRTQPQVIVTGTGKKRTEGTEACTGRKMAASSTTEKRRQLGGFCSSCWKHVGLREGRDEVSDIEFMKANNIFKNARNIDPKARLRGCITEDEFQKFVDNYLKNNKAPGPDGIPNECIKTMSREELDILRQWANEILAHDGARCMTIEEMNGTISLLHKGGDTDDRPRDWRPVVLLNCTNQLVMHVLNARLREIVERAGILEPGQAGGRQGRSTDVNLAKLEWVTRETLAQGKKVYRVDVDFANAFNAMSQAALWEIMRAYGIPDVDLLIGLYANSTVRVAPNDEEGATITFDTGVAQGSALSPLLFLIFMNALLGLLTARGQQLHISHGLESGKEKRGKNWTKRSNAVEDVGQFNSIGFVDDLSLFAQSRGGAQALLDTIQEFESWSGLRVNHKKTCVMIIGQDTKKAYRDAGLVYQGRPIRTLSPTVACRYLGLWGTANGDMTETKERIFRKTREARDMLEHHPLTPEQAVELFVSVGVGAFRYAAALVSWTEVEIRELEGIWVQAYKRAWFLPLSTASDIFTLPCGLGYPRPLGVMAQELCRHLQRCIIHDDVAKQIARHDLDRTLTQWACTSISDLRQEMGLWEWNQTLGTKWARAAKCMQLLDMKYNWEPARADGEDMAGTSWAEATRELRRLRRRVEAMGGSYQSWEEGVWHMDKEQWKLVWEGEDTFWAAIPKILTAGYTTVEKMAQSRWLEENAVHKVPRLARVNAEEGTQTLRILFTRDVAGISERARGTIQRWLDMVDWRAAEIPANSRWRQESVKWLLEKGQGVRKDHPACKWAEEQEKRPQSGAGKAQALTVGQSAMILSNSIKCEQGDWEEGNEGAQTVTDAVQMINPGLHPKTAIRSLLRLLRTQDLKPQEVRRLTEAIGSALPPGWGAHWEERVSRMIASPIEEVWVNITEFMRSRENECHRCQTRLTARCGRCTMMWCKRCGAPDQACEVCDEAVHSENTLRQTMPSAEKAPKPERRVKRRVQESTQTVNTHKLGERFVREVTDVRRTPADLWDGEDPGGGLQFFAQIGGWQDGATLARCEKLLTLNDIGLRVALEQGAGRDIFLIPREHFPQETPEDDDRGWWYCVKEAARCRRCVRCSQRKRQPEFDSVVWSRRQPATCKQCAGYAPSGTSKRIRRDKGSSARNTRKCAPDRVTLEPPADRDTVDEGREGTAQQQSRPRRTRKSGRSNLRDRSESGSDGDVREDEVAGYEECVCIALIPANPRYVGRGSDKSGGEVTYTIAEIRDLLINHTDSTWMWLTSRQMGWSLTRESNEVWNTQDVIEGKSTARILAPMISSYIRGLDETAFSVDDLERRNLLTEAWELDQIWGAWDEEEATGEQDEGRMDSMPESGDDIRGHLAATILRHQRSWEPASRSQLANDPHVLPDEGVPVRLGQDFFLDERIPRSGNGSGYVAVTETSIVWRESEFAELFTYQGLTSCMEPGETWTITGSVWHHLRKCAQRSEQELRSFVHQEAHYQSQIEAEGYRSPSWRILRALKSVHGATRLQGETAVTAAPFFESAGRGDTTFWGNSQGPTVFLWESLDANGRRECEQVMDTRQDWIVWSRTRPSRNKLQTRGRMPRGKALFEGKVRKGKDDGQPTDADELSEDDTDEPRSDREKAGGRACKQRGWWKRGAIETCKNSAGMTAWVHPEFATVAQESLERLEQAWNCADEKDECEVRLEGLERNYWIGSEVGRMGGYEFQGAVFGIDGSNHNGQMGAGCCRLGAPAADQTTRVGREEEGSSSNRPELGGVVLALRQADLDEDVLILCDNESVLKVIRKWVGQGGRASLAKAPDADILREILELLRARINAGRATFFFKVKSHRGEALNERADTLAEMGRERPEEEKRWDQRTDRMTFEVKQGDTSKQSAWTDSVRNAFRKQACQAKLREAYATAARNWADRVWYHHNQRWMRATGEGRAAARDGKFKDEESWGKECFAALEQKNMNRPATSTWCTDFLIRERVGRDEVGHWLRNKSVPWKRRRRLIQVITNTFPCGGWLHKIGRRPSPGCELCKKAKERQGECTGDSLPRESIGHIQSAGCLGQSDVVTAAHNKCIRDLLGDIQMHQRKGSKLVMVTTESERTIGKLWEQEGCSEICTKEELWEESRATEMTIPFHDLAQGMVASEDDFEARFWRRKLDGIALDVSNKKCFPIEFKRTQDYRHTYEEQARNRAGEQYKSLLEGLQAIGRRKGWQIQQLVFVGGACGSVGQDSYNENLKVLEVLESKWEMIRRKMARRLLEEQDKILRSYFAQKYDREPNREEQTGHTMRQKGREHIGRDVYA